MLTLLKIPPFRPILSAIGTPAHKLANFFSPIITTTNVQPVHYKRFILENLKEELKHFNTNLVMASFDVELFFTNIPLQDTIDLCVQKLFEDKN